jgi:nitrogenase-associated protein
MAAVVFYEKPGCINNTKQKRWLRESGHEVIERNLLTHAWSAAELRRFFADLPITQWFNPSAPRIKSGEITPELLDAEQAIALMLAEPLLIRRPLMQVHETTMVGFEREAVDHWIGLKQRAQTDNLEVCVKLETDTACLILQG